MKKLLITFTILLSCYASQAQHLSKNQKHLVNYINNELREDADDFEDVGTPHGVNRVFQNGENTYVYEHNNMFFEISCNHVSMYSSVATKVVVTKTYFNKEVEYRVLELTKKWLKKYNPKKIVPPYWYYIK